MDKVTITQIFIADKNKQGTPFMTRAGKPYKKIAIKTNMHGDQWLSDLVFRDDDPRLQWRQGQTAIIKTEFDGQYYNFKSPTRLDYLEERIERLEKLQGIAQSKESEDIPDEPVVEDLPF